MKKFLAAVTAILMLVSLVTVPLFAEEQTEDPQPVVFAVTGAEVEPGESVAVTVSIAGEYKAHGLTLNLNYDDKLLAIEEIDGEDDDGEPIKVPWIEKGAALAELPENTLCELQPKGATEDSPAFVALGIATISKVFKAQGELFTVHFKVAEDAEVGTEILLDIEVSGFTYMPLDKPAEDVPFVANDGKLTVVAPKVVLEPDEIYPAILHDCAAENPIPDEELFEAGTYTVTPAEDKGEGTPEKPFGYQIAIKGLKEHVNGEGTLGHWFGFAIPAPEGTEKIQFVLSNDPIAEVTEPIAIAPEAAVHDGKDGLAVYFDAAKVDLTKPVYFAIGYGDQPVFKFYEFTFAVVPFVATTGVVSFVGLGIAAILSGAGVVLFRKKK